MYTKCDTFHKAEHAGVAAAVQNLPKRSRKTTRQPEFDCRLAALSKLDPDMAFALMMEEDAKEMCDFVTAWMSAKASLHHFGEAWAQAIMKEPEQLLNQKVMQGRRANTLTKEEKKAALKYLIFLK